MSPMMLMMLAGWGLLDKHVPDHVPNDAHDAGWFAGLLDRRVPADAHVPGWFGGCCPGGCWTNVFPMMLMMLAGLRCCWTGGSLLMLVMLAGLQAVEQICFQ